MITDRSKTTAPGPRQTTIHNSKLDPWSQPLRVPGPGGDFVLTHQPDPRPQYNPALYDFTPADQFNVNGTYVTERTIKEGLGAPLVVVGRNMRPDEHETFSTERVCYGITALVRFEKDHRCVICFADPLSVETVQEQPPRWRAERTDRPVKSQRASEPASLGRSRPNPPAQCRGCAAELNRAPQAGSGSPSKAVAFSGPRSCTIAYTTTGYTTESQTSRGGEIGRRARLRIWFRKE